IDLASGSNDALADVAKQVAAGKTAVVSGYTDATGDAAANDELAKQRAFAVRDALKSAGVPEDKIELKKPEALTGGGDNAQARRVEVALQ
ncbi:MAG: OmpA family protein, partial [Burkholderiaceae bacterium]